MKTTNTHWTERQCFTVASAVKKHLEANPSSKIAGALISAQHALLLPEDRLAESTCRSYTKHAKPLRDALEAVGVAYPSRGARKPVNAPYTALKPGLEEEAAPPSEPRLSQATQAQLITQLLSIHTSEITRLVEAAIATRIAQAFEVTEQSSDHVAEPIKAVLAPRSFQRYLIIGLLPAQAMIANQRLKELCNLRFWSDEGTDRLRSGCGWADCVVSMTKFISHSTEDVVKRTGKPILRCNGGVTDLVTQIQRNMENS